jgi:tRNA modification GTPase
LPGEFSFRAFINGKLDLVQAESIHQLVESRSELVNRFVLGSLKGENSKALTEIENEMLEILAHIEADIDFSTENLQTLAESELARKLESLSHRVRELVRLAADGRKLKSAYRVVFIGPPNVGKSTLFNALCHEDVALVSPEAGTTRDVIKERCLIDGVEIEVADTAGIHETVQQLELLGIAKTQARADQSDILIFVMAPGVKLDRRIVDLFRLGKERGQKAIVVLNKSDLLDGISESEAIRGVQESLGDQMTADTQVFAVSGFDRVQTNLLLRDALRKIVATSDVSQAICFSDWQLDLLSSIQSSIDKGLAALKQGISSEFYALDLREGLYSLQELLGKRFDDDILDRVFSRFCIGK